jgi:hypothetical protein
MDEKKIEAEIARLERQVSELRDYLQNRKADAWLAAYTAPSKRVVNGREDLAASQHAEVQPPCEKRERLARRRKVRQKKRDVESALLQCGDTFSAIVGR